MPYRVALNFCATAVTGLSPRLVQQQCVVEPAKEAPPLHTRSPPSRLKLVSRRSGIALATLPDPAFSHAATPGIGCAPVLL